MKSAYLFFCTYQLLTQLHPQGNLHRQSFPREHPLFQAAVPNQRIHKRWREWHVERRYLALMFCISESP